jgi:hypothetical protein
VRIPCFNKNRGNFFSLKKSVLYIKVWFPYGRNGRTNKVTIFLNGQFIIVIPVNHI